MIFFKTLNNNFSINKNHEIFFKNYFSELYMNFNRVSTLDLENISELIKKLMKIKRKLSLLVMEEVQQWLAM